MFIPNLKEKRVTEVKTSPINKSIYVITMANHAGKQTNLNYTESQMQELLNKTGVPAPEELKGRTVIILDKKVAFLPEGAELTIAARDKEGKLIEFDFFT